MGNVVCLTLTVKAEVDCIIGAFVGLKNQSKWCICHYNHIKMVYIYHTNSQIPSCAALAMSTMLVTLGVSLAKNGIRTACRTHRQMFRTSSGS